MINKLLEYICDSVGLACAGLASSVLLNFGADLINVENSFPIISVFQSGITALGMALLIILSVYSIYSSIISPILNGRGNSPVSAIIRIIFAAVMVAFGSYICKSILTYVFDIQNSIIETAKLWGAQEQQNMQNALFSLSTFSYSIVDSISLVVKGTGGYFLLSMLFSVMFASVYIKVLLQMIESYCWLAILTLFSPVAFSTLASSETSDTSRTWFRCFSGQCILLLRRTFGICVVLYTKATMDSSVLQFVIIYAMAKTITHFDEFLNTLNFRTAPAPGELLVRGSALSMVAGTAARTVIRSGMSKIGFDTGFTRNSWSLNPQQNSNNGRRPPSSTTPASQHSGPVIHGTDTPVRSLNRTSYTAKASVNQDGKVMLSHTESAVRPSIYETASRGMHGAFGQNPDGSRRSFVDTMTNGGGIMGAYRSLSDISAAYSYARRESSSTNDAIDSFNYAMSTSYDAGYVKNENAIFGENGEITGYKQQRGYVAADDLNNALNLHEDSNISFATGGQHLQENDKFMTAIARITNKDGKTDEYLVALGPDADGISGELFNVNKYFQTDSGLRIYYQDNEKKRESDGSYQARINEIREMEKQR